MTHRHMRRSLPALVLLSLPALAACTGDDPARATGPAAAPLAAPVGAMAEHELDAALRTYLARHGFTGRVASTLELRLGRRVDRSLADLGRLLWFDPISGINDDNSCAGCHSPTNGLGDTQSIAIGIGNNGVVGPDRRGPRNQRRTPMALNTAFYPALMWNGRFHAVSGDPFTNTGGFVFPAPEGTTLSDLSHLLVAQAFIPPTERVEAAGFHAPGGNADLRDSVVARLAASPEYRARFARVFADVKAGAPIAYEHFARAIAEFEFTLVFTDAPVDRFARGGRTAMTVDEKRGAVLFFGAAGCVDCHAVSGGSNEMFSDFRNHVAGIPQLVPRNTNMTFDGPGANEDVGLEQVTGNPADRYAFRTAPLRNVALQPAFMHDGAFTRIEDAIRYHLDALTGAASYTPAGAGLPADLHGPIGPMAPILERLDSRLRAPVRLTDAEVEALVAFVRDALLDPAARPARLRHLIPETLPSGRKGLTFQ